MAIHRRIALYALPLISLSLLFPAVLAVFGFYVTGMLLAYQMLRTAWLGAGVLLLGGLLYRGLVVSRQRSAARFASPDSVEGSEHTFHPSLGVSQKDILTAEEKTRRLLRCGGLLESGEVSLLLFDSTVPAEQWRRLRRHLLAHISH